MTYADHLEPKAAPLQRPACAVCMWGRQKHKRFHLFPSNLEAMASNLPATASNLLAMASNLLAMASIQAK